MPILPPMLCIQCNSFSNNICRFRQETVTDCEYMTVRIWQWVSVCVYEASQCFPARLDRLGANRHCASEFNPFIHLINRSCPYRKLHIHNTCYTYHTYICMCNPRTTMRTLYAIWYEPQDHNPECTFLGSREGGTEAGKSRKGLVPVISLGNKLWS